MWVFTLLHALATVALVVFGVWLLLTLLNDVFGKGRR